VSEPKRFKLEARDFNTCRAALISSEMNFRNFLSRDEYPKGWTREECEIILQEAMTARMKIEYILGINENE
jgi:hypothetical protein